jgi:MipA family protein
MKHAYLGAMLMLCTAAAHSEQVPRWEIGVGVGGVSMPDYRGSNESRNYLLPFPYGAYRLDWLKADRDGVSAKLLKSDRIELNMSVGASPPVRSKNNEARQGMPDLKPMVEFGPSLDFKLYRSEAQDVRMYLRLPVRGAFTARTNPDWAGLVFTPKLNLDILALGHPGTSKGGWNLGLVAGPIFADRRQNNYFYTVEDQYALSNRPAYQAQSGYAGTQFLTSLSRKYGKMWVGAYARWDTLHGASFENSPLVKRKQYATAGFAVTWTFAESSEMVERNDD